MVDQPQEKLVFNNLTSEYKEAEDTQGAKSSEKKVDDEEHDSSCRTTLTQNPKKRSPIVTIRDVDATEHGILRMLTCS